MTIYSRCTVIANRREDGLVTLNCNGRSCRLFQAQVSNGRIINVLAADGLKVPKKTV